MLFAIILLTVTSVPRSGQQGSGSYDPWLDYDENGRIDVNELHRLGEAYGSVGDATRNVTIAGHITAYLRPNGGNFSLPAGSDWDSEMISLDGYETVTVLIKASTSTIEGYLYACDSSGYSWLVDHILLAESNWVKTYNVMNQQVQIRIHNGGSAAINIQVAVYLVA
jgi:hypothetical protein